MKKKLAKVIFYLCAPLLYMISILPFWVHYGISRIMYLFGYQIFGYRKRVAKSNLLIAFPEKTNEERLAIEKKFYHFFFDLFVEGIKSFTLTEKQIKKHVLIDPAILDLVNHYYDQGKNIFVVMPHYGNWEYGNFGAQLYFKHQVNCIYKELRDPVFDFMMNKLRTRWGSGMFIMEQAYRKIVSIKDQIHATGFIADQSSSHSKPFWLSFFGKEVPFFTGVEILAKRLDTPVIYIYFDRDKKKRYTIKGKLITDKPKQEEEMYIIKTFAQNLEEQIKLKPELWLWTHRRWKLSKD